MKHLTVTHVGTYDTRGGAGIAASRLHLALRHHGVKSNHVVRFKKGADPHTYMIDAEQEDAAEAIIAQLIQREYIDQRRTSVSNTLFSLGYPGTDILSHPVVRQSDVLNLHWTSSFLSIESIGGLLASRMPIVWTLHDQHAFTGGCHYSAGCQRYEDSCSACPQLLSDPHELARIRQLDRINLFNGKQRPIIVAPSEWMHRCAQGSRVFREAEIHTIANSVPIEKFFPGSRQAARQALGIDDEANCVLFGAESHAEKRKGLSELLVSLLAQLADPQTAQRIASITILCFGEPSEELVQSGLKLVSLGKIDSQSRLRLAYVAADLFVLPSQEDNLPNTILESLACGTPILAFDVGGIPEAVEHNVTGWLVNKGNTAEIGRALIDILNSPSRLCEWSANARKSAETKYSPTSQARKYTELYNEILLRRSNPTPPVQLSGINSTPLDVERTSDFDPIFKSISRDYAPAAFISLWKEHEISQIDRFQRAQQIETLVRNLEESEADRNARGDQIEALTALLKASEEDRNNRWQQIETLTAMLRDCQENRTDRGTLFRILRHFFTLWQKR